MTVRREFLAGYGGMQKPHLLYAADNSVPPFFPLLKGLSVGDRHARLCWTASLPRWACRAASTCTCCASAPIRA